MSVDWAAVYRRSYPDLVQFLYRLTGDEEWAQDLAQDAFARVLVNGHEPDNPRAWVFTFASNLARTAIRTASRRRRHLSLVRDETTAAEPSVDGLAAMERARRREAVRAALAALGDRDQEVLLYWSAGLSYAEIASATGLAPGAIGTTLSRARRRLASAYENVEDRHVARG